VGRNGIAMNIFLTCLESMADVLNNSPDSAAIEKLQQELREMPSQDRATVAEQFNVVASGIMKLTTIDTVVDAAVTECVSKRADASAD
jgi:Asp-tRNA(Asn)/Glu-tRNA(Gln) amidotransferase B subunit